MKFIEYNMENSFKVPEGRKSKETIHFMSSGRISLSKGAIEKFELKVGDTMSILQSEENPKDWYISFHTPKGIPLRIVNNKNEKGRLIIYSTVISEKLFKSLQYRESGLSLKIGPEPLVIDDIKYWPLITAGVKPSHLQDPKSNKPYQFSK